jgi:hypothetical protein
MGRAQGAACRAALGARFARADRLSRWRNELGFVDPEARELDRSLWRSFPHQAENLRGMGAAAGVPAAWLVSELIRLRADPAPAAVLERPSGVLGRGLDGVWLLRRSRPEGLFASLDVVRHGVAAPLLGVNERGLAAAALPGRGERSQAPAWLLVQDCLERFEALEPALDWCRVRPGGTGGGLLLMEASGAAAAVFFEAPRRVERPSAGRWLHAPEAHAAGLGSRLEAAGGDVAGLARALGGAAIDVASRTLCVDGERFGL